MEKISIYALINPINEQLFYVGASASPKARLASHISCKDGTYKSDIIQEIVSGGMKPEMLILDLVDIKQSTFYEDFYIDLFKSYGFELYQAKSCYSKRYTNTIKNEKTYNISIRINEELKLAIEEISSEKDWSINQTIKKALYEYAINEKREKSKLPPTRVHEPSIITQRIS